MLIAAGILFVLALLFWFIDKWFQHVSINLTWLIRLLVFGALVLTALHYYLQGKS